jgi:hypothetical protein
MRFVFLSLSHVLLVHRVRNEPLDEHDYCFIHLVAHDDPLSYFSPSSHRLLLPCLSSRVFVLNSFEPGEITAQVPYLHGITELPRTSPQAEAKDFLSDLMFLLAHFLTCQVADLTSSHR